MPLRQIRNLEKKKFSKFPEVAIRKTNEVKCSLWWLKQRIKLNIKYKSIKRRKYSCIGHFLEYEVVVGSVLAYYGKVEKYDTPNKQHTNKTTHVKTENAIKLTTWVKALQRDLIYMLKWLLYKVMSKSIKILSEVLTNHSVVFVASDSCFVKEREKYKVLRIFVNRL